MGYDFNIYENTPTWGNFLENGRFNDKKTMKQIEDTLANHAITNFSEIQTTNSDLLPIFSFATAQILSKNLKPTQLRRFYTYVKNMQMEIPKSALYTDNLPREIKAKLKFLPPKLAGASAKKKEVEPLYKVITACLANDKIKTKGDFEYFVEFFEAILDYHEVLSD